jgi:hypothetical protein
MPAMHITFNSLTHPQSVVRISVSQHSAEIIYPNSWLLSISKFSISELHIEIIHGTLAVKKPLSPDTSLKMLTEHLQNINNRSI